jgi:hypothetical protein
LSQSVSSNGGASLNDQAFLSDPSPDIEDQPINQFQSPNLTALEDFARRFSAWTKYV